MRFRHPAWIPACWFFSVANLAGVWFAARPGEPWHASVHAVFAVLGAVAAQALTHRR